MLISEGARLEGYFGKENFNKSATKRDLRRSLPKQTSMALHTRDGGRDARPGCTADDDAFSTGMRISVSFSP